MRVLSLGLLSIVAAVAGCNATRTYCEAAADCERDAFPFEAGDDAGNEPDSIAVCTEQQAGRLRALRVNEEDECRALADAIERFQACVAGEFASGEDGCDALFGGDELTRSERDGPCDNEFDDVLDAERDVDDNECTASEQ
jgi:hypothetical protein